MDIKIVNNFYLEFRQSDADRCIPLAAKAGQKPGKPGSLGISR